MSSSDHCLLILTLKIGQQKKPARRRFLFEAMWVREAGCREVVEEAWDPYRGDEEYTVTDRLKSCQANLQRWNWRVFGNVNKTLKRKQERLQQLENLSSLHEKAEEIQELRKEINEVLVREEIMWSQRSRAAWIKWGDRNTRFFHATASQRRRRNRIGGLQNANGEWQENQEDVESIILEYFEGIFKSEQSSNADASLNAIHQRVSPEMNESLIAEFKAEEVWRALKQMHPTKAPGPDGMSPIFFQQYWDIVGPEVINCVLNSLNSGVMPSGINETYICLIPKVKSPQKITEYRPISLCNVIYKIISKVLANRLKSKLTEIIDESQSAFVPGRLNSDNVLVAFETMHSINQRRKGKEALMAVKLDMSKAYDRVEWSYLEAMMRRMGFHERWISLIMMCVTTVEYSVLINGEARGKINPSRGLRQGDPISPYLFLLCTEGLSAMLKKDEREGQIKGVAVCRGAPSVSHLLFADDSIVFCRASVEECDRLISVLEEYEGDSG